MGVSTLRVGRMPRLTYHACVGQVEVRDALGKLIDVA